MKIIKNIIIFSLAILLSLMIFIFYANYTIIQNAKGKTYDSVENIKFNKVGMVLGTSKKVSSGRENLYFKYRIDAIVNLFNHNKINYILVSGDNGTPYYDEPNDMREALLERGIPEDKIFLDYAGFRTLDSVIRSKKVFGQDEITIVSQKFHTERAIFLAEQNGIDAIGFNAKDVSRQYGFKTRMREYLARTKVFFDILFNVQPKFLGEKVIIE